MNILSNNEQNWLLIHKNSPVLQYLDSHMSADSKVQLQEIIFPLFLKTSTHSNGNFYIYMLRPNLQISHLSTNSTDNLYNRQEATSNLSWILF